jgi:hypothetical protein
MILKPENGGPAVALHVTSIVDDVSNKPGKKAQYKFNGRTADGEAATAWIFTDTAERQFARIGITRETASNRWLEFSKTADGYWDINLPAGSPPVVAAPPSAAPVMSAPAVPSIDPDAAKAEKRAEWDKLVKCYRKCYAEAQSIAGDEAGDNGITDVGIATIAASLFQAVLQKGLCA